MCEGIDLESGDQRTEFGPDRDSHSVLIRIPEGDSRPMRTASTKSLLDDPGCAWSPFEPDRARPWDLEAVAHLHRRAGFAAPWAVLQRDLKDGPGHEHRPAARGRVRPRRTARRPRSSSRSLDAMAGRLGPTADLEGLQAIWLYRMVFTPHPLRERMTLFWHNHFATSIAKVQNTALMQRQNELLRGAGPGRLPRDARRRSARTRPC